MSSAIIFSSASPVQSNKNYSLVTKKNSVSHRANADSGSTGEYFAVKDITCLTNVRACQQIEKISVTVANGHSIQSTHFGTLRLPSGHEISAHIFPNINGSLLSVSSFVDLGYTVSYSSETVDFIFDNYVTLHLDYGWSTCPYFSPLKNQLLSPLK